MAQDHFELIAPVSDEWFNYSGSIPLRDGSTLCSAFVALRKGVADDDDVLRVLGGAQ